MFNSNISCPLDDIWLVDVNIYGISGLASVYLVAGEKIAIIDAATPSCVNTILDALWTIERKAEDVAYIVTSHIHLDHASGVSNLLGQMPQAKVVVHERGARHLEDPSRLLASVRKVGMPGGMGDVEGMEAIDKQRIIPVKDGELFEIGQGKKLRIVNAPGHAPHEICILEESSRALFTGDALGMHLGDGSLMLPNAVLPDFDLKLSLETIERLRSLKPEILLFAHFGIAVKATETLTRIVEVIRQWEKLGMDALRTSGLDKVIPVLEDYGCQVIKTIKHNELLYHHLGKEMVPMIAAAYAKHCKIESTML